jgi:tripartite-type tricarboxylate transporter receptor subunit TctC
MMRTATLLTTLAAILITLSSTPLSAQSPDAAFAGKTITVYVGYTAGGSYDLYGRLIARHLGQHLPGKPTVVVQNMPGAGSLKAANYLYEVAPRDGTALGVVVESTALEQALANPAAQYDAAKFTYVGRAATSNNIFMMWHTAKVQSLEEAKQIPSLLASTGPGSIAETIPKLTNALLGTRFKLISGYPASTEAMLAMERGEVDGSSTSWAAVKVGKQDWLRDKKIKIFLQTTPERTAELPDTPCLGEIGTTADDRQVFGLYASGSAIGRSLLGPPGIAPERVAALRAGFDAMAKDAEFIADAKAINVDLEPLPGAAVARLVDTALAVPPAVRQRALAAFGR